MSNLNTNYRPDIDGLRAIAVMAVLLYHLGFSSLPGGFVGVDIFFVISGYLITGIVMRKLKAGEFSLSDFFVRRIKRLFPAMFVVVCLTFVASYFLLPPLDFAKLGASSIASILSFSNLYFWSGTGYFDTDALTKPLLHTWSLGVEEQFYLVWPLLLIGTWKYLGGRFAVVVAVVGGCSFVACQLLLPISQETSFFWMPLRAYEFAVGGLLAMLVIRELNRRVANSSMLLGAALIAYPIAAFNHETQFPGWSAFIPCLGAALIIFAAPHSIFKGLLGSTPAVWLGKCSYSVYLVHWPLIVLFTYYNMDSMTVAHKISLLAASLALGHLLHRTVEQPFRNGSVGALFRLPRQTSATAFFAVISVCGLAFNAWISDGWYWRLPDEVRKSVETISQQRTEYWKKAWDSKDTFKSTLNRVDVIGNSYAVDIYYALKENKDLDVVIDGTTSHKCFAFKLPLNKDDSSFCNESFEKIINSNNTASADYIFLHERHVSEVSNEVYVRGILATLEEIKKINPKAQLVLIGPRADFVKPVYLKILEHGRLAGSEKYLSKYNRFTTERLHSLDSMLKRKSEEVNVKYISLLDMYCNKNTCEILTNNNDLIYWDTGHWTLAGSKYLNKKLREHGVYGELFGI